MTLAGIQIPITFGNPADVAAAVENLGDKLSGTADDAAKFQREQDAAARASIEITGKAAAAASQVAAFGRTIRSDAITALGELASQSASSAQQFAALGATLGPQGALVGGIVGALLPAIGRLIGETDDQAEAQRDAADAAREERERLDELTESIRENYRAREERTRLRQGNFASADEADQVQRESAQDARAYAEEIRRLDGQITRFERLGIAVDNLRERREQLRALQFSAESQSGTAEEALQGFTQAGIAEAGNEERDRRRAAARGNETSEAGAARFRDQVLALNDMLEDAAQASVDRRKAIEDEYRDYQRAQTEALVEAEIRAKRNAEQADEERAERAMERMRAQQEADRDAMRANEERYARSRENTREYADMVGAANGLFIDAIQETINGTKSAEDAFKGLLAGFLEYISQQAALKAAFEYGEAIAAFARQDYAGGAQHIGAGVAYTAVAVLAGVGAAAITPPAAQTQAAEPSRDAGGSSGPSGDTVINFNSPFVTAGTRDELGRELRGMIRGADERFGG